MSEASAGSTKLSATRRFRNFDRLRRRPIPAHVASEMSGLPRAASQNARVPRSARQICTVCCATKRQVEIKCPADCVYLTSARAHPPAVVQRRQERDLGFLLPLVSDLTETQYRLVVLFQSVTVKHAEQAVAVAASTPTSPRRPRPPRRRSRPRARASSTSTRRCRFRRSASPTELARVVSRARSRRTRRSNRGSSATRPLALRKIEAGARERGKGARGRRHAGLSRAAAADLRRAPAPRRRVPGTER